MSSLLCISALIGLALLMTSLPATNGAPTRQRRSLGSPDHSNRENTLLSLVLDSSELTDDSARDFLEKDTTHNGRRLKRNANSGRHHLGDDIPLALNDEDLRELTPDERRHRRSAAWWMAAMVRLCDKHNVCRQAEITDGEVTVVVKMADE